MEKHKVTSFSNYRIQQNWSLNFVFLFLISIVIYSKSAIATCDGIVVNDYSKNESIVPFQKPPIPSDFNGTVDYFIVVNENGELVNNFDQQAIRKRLLDTSKRHCVSKKITYPDVVLISEKYKDGKLLIATAFENNAKIEKKANVYDPPGTLVAIFPFENNLIDGEAQFLFPNGQLNYVLQYRKNNREGCYEAHFIKGTILGKGCFINDKQEGKLVQYYENGAIKLEANFKNGKLDGVYSETFINGKPKVTARYADGIIIDTANVYFEDGTISEEYVNGNVESPGHYNRYYKDGKTLDSVPVINNKYDGNYAEFNEQGNQISIGTYKVGLLEGAFKKFYDNGVLKSEVKYTKGKETFYEDYYSHGGLQTKGIYTKGNELLKIQTYNLYGALDTEYPIKNGEIDGDVTKFYRTRSVAVRTKYIKGKPTNPVSSFYPNGAKQYLAYLTANGQLSVGAFYGVTGKKLKYFKTFKDGITSQFEYYDSGVVKSGIFSKQDGSEERYYYLETNVKTPALQQVFKKNIGLTLIQMSLKDKNLLCLWQEETKKYLCGTKDLVSGQIEILDNNTVITNLNNFAETNGFEKAKLDDFINANLPAGLFSINNSKLISDSIALNEKKQHCYNLGFMEYCE